MRRGAHARRALASGCGAITLVIAACLPRTTPAPEPVVDETWVFSCPGDYQFSTRVLRGLVSIRLPNRTMALPRARSETGIRYAAGGDELLRTGETATLRVSGETHAGCTGQRAADPWEEARMLGADLRAVGVEPAWSLEIHAGRQMRFLIEGSSEVITPVPEPVRADGTVAYQATSEGHEIDVTIREEACTNPLLGAGYTHTVRLRVDGFPYVGCGRMLGSLPAGS